MSADNWAICPRCRAAAEAERAERRQRADDAYGILSIPDFDALRAEADEPIDENALTTFREDYEIGSDDGVLAISYSGRCETCGLAASFEHEETFYEADSEVFIQ